MKLCQKCGQSLAEEIAKCPSCGSDVGEGRKYIDDYRIEEVLHEGHGSILCRAVKKRHKNPVTIRIFTPQSGVDKQVAARLKRELKDLKKLPGEFFVIHQEIKHSSDGLWYRVSEWIDAEGWGDLVGSGRLSDYRVAFDLFSKIASILAYLHQSGHIIPHLILNDVIVVKDAKGEFDVKIDYKLSRFFDPKLDKPGPMLKQLLSCHPDIINARPLDYRSDIWSLAKIFVEILTASFEVCDYLEKVDELPLPQDIKALFKTMLAKDPDLRPRSMKDVAEALDRITDQEIVEARKRKFEEISASAQSVLKLKRRQIILAILVVLLFVAGGVFWYNTGRQEKDSAAVLEEYANQYAKSVGFVLVEYWLKVDTDTVYSNQAEGTAFLVDHKGYLLTNRHVACPWLEDAHLYMAVMQLQQNDRSPRFGYRIFFWFEGEKAFNRSAGLIDSPDLDDIYFTGSAFRSDGTPRLTIAGVAKPPVQIRQLVASPLKDDFAVLKIDRVPEGLTPLPLDIELDPMQIPKLSSIITMGFPLGSRTQAATVNVSVAMGHVRRTFENLIQIDAALYGGNSGGPVIDMRGKVVGIASGVATDRAPGLFPVETPLWNLAMVLPVTKAADFLHDLQAGQAKWNGVLDLSVDAKLKGITEKAAKGHWAEAMELADKELERSADPSLVLAGGMMHFLAGDKGGARRLFVQSLSMDNENNLAGFMLLIIDWLDGNTSGEAYREALLDLDWRSPDEFMGYLARVLTGLVDEESALKAWDTTSEKSWLLYTVGLIRDKGAKWAASETLLRKAVLAADPEAWPFFLAKARLDEIRRKRLGTFNDKDRWTAYQADVNAFDESLLKDQAAKTEGRARVAALKTRLEMEAANATARQEVLALIHEADPDDRDVLVGLAFYSAMDEDWSKALEYAKAYLKRDGRQNAARLSLGLLEAETLYRLGRSEEAQTRLEDYVRRMRDPWYRAVSEVLQGKRSEDSLKQEGEKTPENLLVLQTALGFWSEGSGDNEKAMKHYKVAMESFMTTRVEFDFARERLKKLRRASK